ncbi:MAG: flagellar filament capping protein FliD [Candidatus Sulfotelmatobacter sp.]
MGVSLNPSTILSGQGIDVSSVVQQILSSQSGQLTVWETQSTTLASENGVLDGIGNDLTNLQTAVAALADPTGALAAQAVTSSNTASVTARAQDNAVAGTHQIVVNSLATAGTVYTNPLADPTTSFLPTGASGGDIQLQVGGSSGTTYDIPITPGSNDTLDSLSSYINSESSANNWGVTASVVNNGSGYLLALQSQNTGSTGALAIVSNTVTGTLSTADLANASTSILPNGQTTADIQLQIGGSSGSTEDIPITQGSNDTLTTLASYINTQSTQNNWGVTASVVTDSGGAHLAIQSQASGPAGDLAFTNNTTNLAVAANPATSLSFATPEGGTNASLTIDGVPFSSASNTLTGAIQGITLNLLSAAPDAPVQLTVAPDTDQISSAVNNFVSAYKTLVSDINAQYVVDPTGSTPAPPLESDTSLRSLQSSILADASYAITGNSGLVNLASLGINMNNDGSLTVGSNASGQTFAQVVGSNPSAVQNFFQNSSNSGFANIFNTDLTNLTDPTTGPLNAEVTENTAEEQGLTTDITNFQTQLSNQQTALTAQYDSVNASLQSYPLLLQEVTETLGTLNSGTSSTGELISSEPTLTSGL